MKSPSTISLPQGVRDILPEEAERICKVESAILSVFSRFGFKRVITPLLEYVDVLSLGMGKGLKEKVFKFIDPSTGKVVALRPDITPQIARMVATRMRDYPLPQKLCYNENVLRYHDARGGKSREILQIGAEYISTEPSPEIDAGMIITAIEGLKKAGVRDFKIDIGDVGFVRTVLERLRVSESERKLIKDAVEVKDNSGLEAILAGLKKKVDMRDKKLLLALPTFYGEAEVIEKARALSTDNATKGALENVKAVLAIITRKGYKESVTVDLGEVRGFDYYTGIIFEGFASGIGKPILGGGRYDTLLEKYGYRASSTGFAYDVENIVTVLERGD
jgi:ATP phosphoribosyltransferase regulatory subunit